MELRDYQASVVKDVYGNIRNGSKKVLLYAGTGAGKTVIATKVIEDALSRGRKCMFVVHRDVLVGQTAAMLGRAGIIYGVIKGGAKEYRRAPVQIASVQTLARRDWWKEWGADLLIWDEAHINAFSSACKDSLSDFYRDSIHLFLTASPFWLDKKRGAGLFADSLAASPMPQELIDRGYLSPLRYFGSESFDLNGVKTLRGEYAVSDLATKVDVPQVYDQVFGDWERLASDRRSLAFCVSVEHAEHVADYWRSRRRRAAVVTGSTPHRPKGQAPSTELVYRQDIYEALARGDIDLVSSCDALSEGFDVPSIECCILWRPTKSYALLLQQVGRGMRISPGTGKKDCVILDPSGNIMRHGFIEELTRDRITLEAPERSKPGEAPIKTCPECGHLERISAMKCAECGYTFPEAKAFVPMGELIEISAKADKQKLFYERQITLAFNRKYSPDYALMKFKERYGEFPAKEVCLSGLFKGDSGRSNRESMMNWLSAIALSKQSNPRWVALNADGDRWAERWMEREFGAQKVEENAA